MMKKIVLVIINIILANVASAQVCLTASSAAPFAVGFFPSCVISADFNNDGNTDLATADGQSGSNTISVLLGNGAGSFAPAVNFVAGNGVAPRSLISADFNADGNADLAVGVWNGVVVLFGNGLGSFTAGAVKFSAGENPNSITSADFNGDGKVDLATGNYSDNTISVLLGNGTGSFATAVTFAAGTNPLSLISADFNNDGKADLAVTNYNGNTISVLLGNGTGSFAAMVNFTSIGAPYSITSADFNADGNADLAAANKDNGFISVLFGNGAGSFAPAVYFSVLSTPYSITSADFNNDGKTDLAVTNRNYNSVAVLIATGTGSFATPVYFAAGTDPHSIISADFNKDGKVDLAVANSDTTVSVLLNNTPYVTANATASVVCAGASITLTGGGATTYTWSGGVINGVAFIPPIGSTTYTVTGVTTVGCTNTATQLIIVNAPTVTINATSTVVCAGTSITLTGGGATTYTWSGGVINGVAFIPPIGSTTYTLTATNAAGCTNTATQLITVNAPTVTINATSTVVCAGTSITLTGGGATTYTWSGGVINGVAFIPPIGSTTYTLTATNAAGCTNTATQLITVNALPTVTTNAVSTVVCVGTSIILTGSGAATYTWSANAGSSTAATVVVAPNVTTNYTVIGTDTNGCINSASVTQSVGVCLGVCLTHSSASPFAVGSVPRSVISADFNADGQADLAVANINSNNVSVLIAVGAGSFATAVNFSVGTSPYSVTSADFNSDGNVDLAVANRNSNNVSVLFGNGAGSFATAVNFSVGTFPFSITSADFNSDGNVDLVTANQGSSDVSVLLGNGVGSFATAVNFSVGTNPLSITSADFNADGQADLAVANMYSNDVAVLIATGGGSFAPVVNFAVGTQPFSITSVDFNTDGKADLAVANYGNNNVSVLFGNGAGSFAAAVNFAVGINPFSLTSADFNADGQADLAVANANSNNVSVLLSNGAGGFASAIGFAVGTNPVSIISADFNSDGKADLAAANQGSYDVSVLLNGTLSLSVNPTSTVVCAGTSITLTGGGATTYTWSGGINNGIAFIPPTGSTTYTVTGTNTLGCMNAATQLITVNAIPTITINSGTICSGNNYTLTPNGASTYTFSSGSDVVSPTTTTNYTVTGTDGNGCSNSANSLVTVKTNPIVSVNSGSICSGENYTLTPNGAVTYTFSSGSDVVSPTTTTNYTVTGTDGNGCSNSATSTINVNAAPVLNLVPSTSLTCAGSSITILASVAPASVSYLWNNLATTQSIVVSPMLTSIYSAIVTDNVNGCNASNSTTLTIYPLPSLTVTGTNSVCIGSSASIDVTGALTYVWSNAITTSSINVSNTVTTTYTVTGTDANHCSNLQTVTIAVDNTCADVWPGDVSSDGVVDYLDVLELGLHYGQTGTPRATTSNLWQSYYAANWSGTISNGKNLNHSNCNGDGIINDDDTLAIFNNYNLTHAFKPVQTNSNPVLTIVPDQNSVVKGSWSSASIYLGDATTPISNINGVAFTVNYDNTLLANNGIWIEYPTSFINVSNQNLKFRKPNFTNGKLYTATTHTVNGNVSGYGKIATLHYKINPTLTTDNVLNLSVSQVNQSSANGSITPLTSGSATLMALGSSITTNLNELLNGNYISISPNPTNGSLTINSKTDLQKIEVMAITGQLLISEVPASANHLLHLDHLVNGIYFVNLYQNNRIVKREKIILNK